MHACSVMSNSLQPHGLQPTRLLYLWEFPGKNTGVGCHFLLQEAIKKLDLQTRDLDKEVIPLLVHKISFFFFFLLEEQGHQINHVFFIHLLIIGRKTMSLNSDINGFKLLTTYLLLEKTWANHLNPLTRSFLTYKMGITISTHHYKCNVCNV